VRSARPAVSDHVESAVHRALARLPADRFRTAAEFAEALTTPGIGLAPAMTGARPGAEAWGAGLRRRHLVAAGGLLLVSLAAGLAGWLRRTPERPGPVVRLVLDLPGEARIQAGGGQVDRIGSPLALSPDGTVLVYRGSDQLFVRRLDQIEPVPLPNTGGAVLPFFSPDGQQVGFYANGSVKRVALVGGPAVTLSSAASNFAGGTWSQRDVIVFAAAGGLYRVAATGGPAERIVTTDTLASRIYRWPEFLPDGRRLLVTLAGTRAYHVVGLLDLGSGHVAPIAGLGEWSTNPRFVEPNWLIYLGGEGTVFAVPFDWRAGRVTGTPMPVLEDVDRGVWGDATLGLSRNGWAVYLKGSVDQRHLTLVDRRGTARALPVELRPYSDPRFSPDGRHVAATILSLGRGLTGDIWVFDLRQSTLSRLTFDGVHQFPEWSGDGRRLVFAQFTVGAAEAPVAGGPVTTLFQNPNVFEATLTHDGRTIVYRANGVPGDLYYVRRDSLDHPHAIVASPFDERALALSPDDRWLAYVSDESGRNEVYVRAFPEGGERWQISVAGGTEPRWRRDGLELFYRNADTLLAAQLRTRPDLVVGQRVALFRGDYVANARHAGYDVHPDGQQFVFVTAARTGVPELILVQNLLPAVPGPRAGPSQR
jgi:serine/threonine-protein kinase